MRTSDYNIYVPLPNTYEYIMIHGYSGAVDVVQKGVVKFLQDFGDGGSLDNVPEETIASLKQRGYLTERTPEQEQDFVRKLGRALHNVQKKRAGFLLMPTYDCNLRCPYCYEKRLRGKGRAWLEKTMDRAMVDAAYDAMTRIRQDLRDLRDDVRSEITLYGGEPFLKRNAETVNYIVEKGCELGYEFKAITNGVELDGFLDLLGKEKVSWVQITLDGPPQIHDKRRCKADGSGSFADIARNISTVLEHGVSIVVRTNVDGKNIDYIPDLVDVYVNHGWVDESNFQFYCSAVQVRPRESDQESLLTDSQLARLVQESSKWHPRIQLMTVNKHLQRKFRQLLTEGYPLISPVSCGSHLGMYLFDAHGDIYACWDSVGEPIGKVGRYLPELVFDQEALDQWHERTIMSIPECVACKYALLCGGGCAQHAYYATGNLKSPYCQDFGELFCAAVPVAYKEHLREREKRGGLIAENQIPEPR